MMRTQRLILTSLALVACATGGALPSFAALQTNVVERHYDRFGRPVGVSLNGERRTEITYDEATGRISSNTPWRFSSEYVERELGVACYQFRDFNFLTGAWMSRDDIAVETNMDGALYLFCINNPVGTIDILGRCPALLLYPGIWVAVDEVVTVVVESAVVSYLVTYAIEKSVNVYQKYKEECGKCAIGGVDTRTELRQREINRRKLKEKCIDRCWHLLPSRYGDAAESNRCMRECEAGH